MEITSKNNPKIIEANKLNKKSYRDEKGLFLCDSYKMIYEFIKNSYFEIFELFVHQDYMDKYIEIISLAEEKDSEIFIINDQVMKKLSDNKSMTGICCVFRKKEKIKATDKDFIIALDEIQDPLNVGAVIRAAAAFDVPVMVSENSADIYSPKTVKASMGGIGFDKIFVCSSLYDELMSLKEKGYNIVSTALSKDSIELENYDISQKTVIVIGNEGSGVSERILEISNYKVIIPMKGNIQSLNAAVAAGIVMWEKVR